MKKILLTLFIVFFATVVGAYNKNFALKYKDAKAKYEQGQYESAKKVISNALNTLPNLSAEQIKEGKELLSLCNQKIAFQNRLNLAADNLIVSYDRKRDSVGVDAGKPQLLAVSSSAPDWCVVEGIRNNYVYFYTEFNEKKESREADIIVKMGKGKSKKIHVFQGARPETTKQVVIETMPDRARISVDGSESLVGMWEGVLPSGDHRVHVEKGEYAPRDTVITILDDMRQGETVGYSISLYPRFAKLALFIEPEDGFAFDSAVVVKLNNVVVQESGYSYDDERDEILKFTRYEDGTIPVNPGLVSVDVSSDHFAPFHKDIRLSSGETCRYDIKLPAKTGFLELQNGGNAEDSRVLLDGREIGVVSDVLQTKVLVGTHKLELFKDGYKSSDPEYLFEVFEGQTSSVKLSMNPYVPYVFKSSPDGAQVFVDGVSVGDTPTPVVDLQEREAGHFFEIEYRKEGFLPVRRWILPDYTETAACDSVALWEALPYSITADEDDVRVTITNKEDEGVTFYNRLALPADIVLPLRSTKYDITAYRLGKKHAAFRGKLKFDNPENNHRNIRLWSKRSFQLLNAEFAVTSFQTPITGFESRARFVKANLLNLKFLPGLSSSVFRGFAFVDSDFRQFLPAISFLFLNWDFRAGGGLWDDWIDVNALVSYAWSPPIWNWYFFSDRFQFKHLVGHDVFFGAELSLRGRYITPTIKAGYQMFPGMKWYTPNGPSGKYAIEDVKIKGHFVVSLCISLTPSKDSKGNNILHLW